MIARVLFPEPGPPTIMTRFIEAHSLDLCRMDSRISDADPYHHRFLHRRVNLTTVAVEGCRTPSKDVAVRPERWSAGVRQALAEAAIADGCHSDQIEPLAVIHTDAQLFGGLCDRLKFGF